MKSLTAYLNFDGNCREALEFYQRALGGKLEVMTFRDGAEQFEPPVGREDRVMHACLMSGGMTLMASDTMPGMPYVAGNSVWLMQECETDEEVQTLYDALAAGGQEIMAPHDTFWGARFAMFTDRFGMNWMLSRMREGAMA